MTDVIGYCSYYPFSSTSLVTSSATFHRYGCYRAFAAFSCSALMCSSEQNAVVAADAMEPDVLHGRVPDVVLVGNFL
jgi:hypothetical protein